jgi:hypothetical protein
VRSAGDGEGGGVTAWAYEFSCERSLAEMEPILDRSGPWRWTIRDCAWYPDFLQCRPQDDVRICLYERNPPRGPAYRCHVEIAPRTAAQRASIEPVLVGLLGKLPVDGLVEVDAGEWPFD